MKVSSGPLIINEISEGNKKIMTLDITSHSLVPEHLRVSDAEKEKLYTLYNINSKKLPKIMITDPAIAKLTVKVGDIIKIERQSKTAGISFYFREVADE